METRAIVGNDVMDLDDPRCRGRSEDGRFLERVFTTIERRRIATADDPDRTLWVHWAAKEAGFKVVTKLRGWAPPFEHAAFQVTEEEPGRGWVEYEGARFPFEDRATLSEADGFVHVLAWPEPRPAFLEGTVASLPAEPVREDAFSDLERRAIYSPASGWVRFLAREAVVERLGSPEGVEIVCAEGRVGREPPIVLLKGRPAPLDVSFSHHGRFVAWAMAAHGPP